MKDNFEYELSERDFLDAIYLRAKKNPYNIQEEWYKIILISHLLNIYILM